jgi:hypothetical protein
VRSRREAADRVHEVGQKRRHQQQPQGSLGRNPRSAQTDAQMAMYILLLRFLGRVVKRENNQNRHRNAEQFQKRVHRQFA